MLYEPIYTQHLEEPTSPAESGPVFPGPGGGKQGLVLMGAEFQSGMM